MNKNILLSSMRPIETDDLVRLGRDADGGYLINQSAVANSDLISFGINDDWSFELDFVNRFSGNVTMYDASVSLAKFRTDLANLVFDPFSLNFIYRIFRIKNTFFSHLLRLGNSYKTWSSFKNFIAKPRVKFYSKYVSNIDSGNFMSISTLFSNLPENKIYFFKIDIEGDEYRILDELCNNSTFISGMVIEFHDLDVMQVNFLNLLDRIKSEFYITHIHANNFNKEHPVIGIPAVWEITFLNKKFHNVPPQLVVANYPIHLDRRNTEEHLDYSFSYV